MKKILSILFMSAIVMQAQIIKPVIPSTVLIPPSGSYNYFFNKSAADVPYLKKSDNTIIPLSVLIGTVTSSINWGSITGTLALQTDLNSALNSKMPLSDTSKFVNIVGVNGQAALGNNVDYNCFLGYQSGLNVKPNLGTYTGVENTSLGYSTLLSLTSGIGNVAIGKRTLEYDTNGNYNVGVGDGALLNMISGNSNIGIGHHAGASIITGSSNIHLGEESGSQITTGSYNVGIGEQANGNGVNVFYNTAIGHNALISNTASNYNTALGGQAGYLTTGSGNTLIGYSALWSNRTGYGNTVLGYNAGYNVLGIQNVIVGYNSGMYGKYSNYLFIDNADRNDSAHQWRQALLVGKFGLDSSVQSIRINGKVQISDGSQASGKVLISNAQGVATWSTIATTTSITATSPLSVTSGSAIAIFYGTGLALSSGSLITSAIPNSSLANSTISGVSLGSNLFSHTAGFGLSGTAFNGSAAQTIILDTSNANGATSKLYVTAKLGGKQNTLNGTGFVKSTGTVVTYDNSTYNTGSGTSGQVAVYNGANSTTSTSGLTYSGGLLKSLTTAGEQFRSAYDGSNYTSFTTNSVGLTTVLVQGTSSAAFKIKASVAGANFFKVERQADDAIFGISDVTGADPHWRFYASYNTTGAYLPTAFYTSDVERMRIAINGNITVNQKMYIGGSATNTPTALMHIAAGTSTASTGQIKANAGTLMTVAEANTFLENDGTNFYGTPNTTVGRWPYTFNSVQYVAPVTGNTVTATAQISQLVCNPSGTLVALNIVFPSSPVNGQSFGVAISQIITTLTLTGAGTDVIDGSITTSSVNSNGTWVYVSAAVNGGATGIWFKSH